MTSIRTRLAATASAVITLAGAALAAAPADATAPGGSTAPARRVHHTRLTFDVAGCEGCRIRLVHAERKADPTARYWTSKERVVRDGSVTFRPSSRHTHGMSMTVRAPWEGLTGYVTETVFRYAGKTTGDTVTFAEARSKRHASGCWDGTNASELTLDLTVRKVWVQGVRGRTRGTIAYLPVTDRWQRPMQRVYRGVLGTQDVDLCGSR